MDNKRARYRYSAATRARPRSLRMELLMDRLPEDLRYKVMYHNAWRQRQSGATSIQRAMRAFWARMGRQLAPRLDNFGDRATGRRLKYIDLTRF